MRRSDRATRTWLRSKERTTKRGGNWYFETREGERGPFASRKAARFELQRYVDTMDFLDENEDSLPPGADWGNITLIDIEHPKYG